MDPMSRYETAALYWKRSPRFVRWAPVLTNTYMTLTSNDHAPRRCVPAGPTNASSEQERRLRAGRAVVEEPPFSHDGRVAEAGRVASSGDGVERRPAGHVRVCSLSDIGPTHVRQPKRDGQIVGDPESRVERGALDRADRVRVLVPACGSDEVLIAESAEPNGLVSHEGRDVARLERRCGNGDRGS